MVSQFINRNKPVEELTTEEDHDEPTNRDIAAGSDPASEGAEAEESCESDPASDLQEIEEFLYENEDEGKVRPLKKRPRMMEIPYSTGVSIESFSCFTENIENISGHALNKSFNRVVFTCEEEFRMIDYLFRIQKYQNMRSDQIRASLI